MKTLEDFEEWELRHLKKRTFDFGLSSVRLKISDYLEDKSKINKLEEALSRLSEISSLSKTCKRADCEVCKKVENLKPERSFEEKWELSLELWKWQKECREKWIENGGEGIVKVVTGAGKTILALAITSYLKNKSIYSEEGLKNIIVVPNTALLDQWYSETKDLLNLEDYEIGVFYGEEKDNIAEKNLMIYVLNSARRHLKKHLKNIDDDIFLIADECHRFASQHDALRPRNVRLGHLCQL